ncbi:hypothetical protein J422_03853 [Methanocaldococcus villosus KIN24-T80]|uniref:Uncharacterized protein n=1 Tax=Methanocaldococcus villosus KIN24-T80 TaxID=1069083 RepID=N6VSL3_9EURY|nr:hypothetical protein [Methanocaldococcus villosus]ENN96161.1 hypothetical protein J422_03853 [Methanocaldococcus villosus KIN24-T80]
MKPKHALRKDMIGEFTLNKSFNTYRGKIIKADFNSPLEGIVMKNKKDQVYFYPLLALHMVKPLNCIPINVIPKTSLPTNPKNIHIKEALSRIVGRTLKVFYENPKTSYLGRLLGFTRGVFSWTLVLEIHGEVILLFNPDYIVYYGTRWDFLKNNPPYKPPKLMNVTKTANYLKRCLLEDVIIEPEYPRINIDNKVFVYPFGVIGKDEYLRETVETILKEKEFLN